jgi:hypothetical protein
MGWSWWDYYIMYKELSDNTKTQYIFPNIYISPPRAPESLSKQITLALFYPIHTKDQWQFCTIIHVQKGNEDVSHHQSCKLPLVFLAFVKYIFKTLSSGFYTDGTEVSLQSLTTDTRTNHSLLEFLSSRHFFFRSQSQRFPPAFYKPVSSIIFLWNRFSPLMVNSVSVIKGGTQKLPKQFRIVETLILTWPFMWKLFLMTQLVFQLKSTTFCNSSNGYVNNMFNILLGKKFPKCLFYDYETGISFTCHQKFLLRSNSK